MSVQPDEDKLKPAPKTSVVGKINKAINGTLERAFNALGQFIARRPVLVIVVAIILSVILTSGVTRIETETRREKLFIPDGNESTKNQEFVREYFPSLARSGVIYLEREDGSDVLTPEAFNKALTIHQKVLELQWTNIEDGGDSDTRIVPYLPETQGLTDLCFNIQGFEGADNVLDCSMTNPLMLFGYNESGWNSREGLLNTLNAPESWEGNLTRPGFVLEAAFGGIERSGGQVIGAKVLALTYLLASNKTLVDEQKTDEAAAGFEDEFLSLLADIDEEDSTWHVRRFAERSFEDEFAGTLSGDLFMLQVALVAIVVYTYISISNWRDGIVGSRLLLTIGGIINIVLALGCCYGFAGYLGLLFSPLMSILPFIMLGVGVDGMFVLQSALDATSRHDSMQVRMGEAMRHGGLSVAVASMTNFFAFLIGSNTSLPVLAAFSVYAALAILFDLLLQITFFAAIMCIDQRRVERRAADIMPCIGVNSSVNSGYCCGIFGKPSHSDGYRMRVMHWVGTQYTKWPVKAVVLALWLGLLGAGIYGTSQMRVDADVNDFIPEGSYLKDWLATVREHFGETGTTCYLYWVNDNEGPVDFTETQVQQQMTDSLQLFRDNEFVVGGTLSSWWDTLLDTSNATTPGGNFYPELQQFLSAPEGARFKGDIVFAENSSEIFTVRSTFQWRYIEDTTELIDAMDSMRDTTALIPAPLGTRTFVHSNEFLNIEQYKQIGGEAVMNIGLGFAMIAIVILFLLASPLAAALTFVAVASAILELVGFMYFRGAYIDSVIVIFLVVSLGLAVDYSVHVAHGYLATREEDPVLRMQKTMSQTGVAVVNGALSTLIAALCLAGSGSYVFITFFYSLLFIVLFGAFSGLVVLPVLLDIFQPPPHVEIIHASNSNTNGGEGTETEAADSLEAVAPNADSA